MSVTDPLGFVGTTIASKYRVDRVLGEGGFGVVYAGEHLALGEPIALKCIKLGPFVDEQRASDVFLREARVLFSLTHPAIVRMYDVGTVQTPAGLVPYVVLELVAGVSLEEEIARRRRSSDAGPFSAPEILGIFDSVLDGISFAHQAGIAHRDLKPSNVMLVRGPSGALGAKLLDFGTARVGSQLTSVGATSAMGFTPRYAAPEQWNPTVGSTGPASDVFSLGLILAECCTLMPALAGATPSDILAEVMSPARSIAVASRRPDLSPTIDTVLARATRIAPPERFASARDMASALRDALARPPAAPGRVPTALLSATPAAPARTPNVAPSLPVSSLGRPPFAAPQAPLPTPAPAWTPSIGSSPRASAPALAPFTAPARAPAPAPAPTVVPYVTTPPRATSSGRVSGAVVGGVAFLFVTLLVSAGVGIRSYLQASARADVDPNVVAPPATTADPPPATPVEPSVRHKIKTSAITPGQDIDRRALKDLVEARFPDVDACYGAVLDDNGRLRGTMTLSIRVSAEGATAEAFCDKESAVKDTRLCECVANVASTWRFPATPSGTRFIYAIELAP